MQIYRYLISITDKLGVTRVDPIQCNWTKLDKLIYSIQNSLLCPSFYNLCRFSSSRNFSMAQTIELAQVLGFLSRLRPFVHVLDVTPDSQTRLSEVVGKEISRSLAITAPLRGRCTPSPRCCWSFQSRALFKLSKVVRQLPIPIYERQFASRACIHHFKNRICDRISTYVGQARPVPSWFPRHRNAYQGMFICFIFLYMLNEPLMFS